MFARPGRIVVMETRQEKIMPHDRRMGIRGVAMCLGALQGKNLISIEYGLSLVGG